MAEVPRWFIAAIVAVSLLLIEVAAMGISAGAPDSGPAAGDALPAEITIPRPRVGDEVRYAYYLTPRDEAKGAAPAISCTESMHSIDGNNLPPVKPDGVPYLDFRIEPAATIGDGRGGSVEAYAAHVLQYGFDCNEDPVPGIDAVQYVDANTLEAVANVAGRVVQETGPGLRYSMNSTQVHYATDLMGRAYTGWWCMPWSTWQGKTLQLDRRQMLRPECDIPMFMFDNPDAQFEGGWGAIGYGAGLELPLVAVRTEQVDGHPAVVFHLAGSHPQGQTEVWMSPDFPYPVRYVIEEYRNAEHPALNYVMSIRLEGYKRGDAELPSPGAEGAFPTRALLPETGLAFAKRQPWGMDEAGVQHPFPASAAWQWLGQNATFADFQKRHPLAQVVRCYYRESVTYDERTLNWGNPVNSTHRIWNLEVSDGSVSLGVSVDQTTSTQSATPLSEDPLGLGATKTVATEADIGEETVVDDGYRPPPSRMPETLPTVASLWKAYGKWAPDSTPNRWGFDLRRGPHGTVDSEPWEGPTSQDWSAGLHRRARVLADKPGDPLGRQGYNETETTEERDLTFSENGQTVEFREAIEGSSPAGGAQPLTASEYHDPLRLEPATGLTWEMPAAPAVAGASLIAVLAGGLVALLTGKGAKGLGLAFLFSRVRPDAAAEHPSRHALLAAIETMPGIHFKELQRRTGQSKSSTQHHLAILLKANAIQERRDGGYVC